MNNNDELMPVSAIIPAAGISQRMGSDKALLAYDAKHSFAGHLVKSYAAFGVQNIVMIVNDYQNQHDFDDSHVIHVVNQHVEYGRSYSIFLGLQQISRGCACFVQNIDNPFVETDLLEQMIEKSENDGFVVPLWNGKGGHPILLGRNVVNYIRDMNTFQEFRDVLKAFKRIELPYSDERILWNINTPLDYARFLNS